MTLLFLPLHSQGAEQKISLAQTLFPGCDVPDIWTIDYDKVLHNVAGEDFDFSVAELAIERCL